MVVNDFGTKHHIFQIAILKFDFRILIKNFRILKFFLSNLEFFSSKKTILKFSKFQNSKIFFWLNFRILKFFFVKFQNSKIYITVFWNDRVRCVSYISTENNKHKNGKRENAKLENDIAEWIKTNTTTIRIDDETS